MKKSLKNDQIHPESIKIYTKSKDNILIEDQHTIIDKIKCRIKEKKKMAKNTLN